MAKRNYGFEKRQKELARKRKKEAKRQRKFERAQESANEPEGAEDTAQAADGTDQQPTD